MTKESCEYFFKLYMKQGLKEKAYAIYKGYPPEHLIEEPKEEKPIEEKPIEEKPKKKSKKGGK